MQHTAPAVLAPYLRDLLTRTTQQALYTSVIDASTNWLVLATLSAAYHVVDEEELMSLAGSKKPPPFVAFISLTQPKGAWIEMGKKVGIDMASLISHLGLLYVDGLSANLPGDKDADTGLRLTELALPIMSTFEFSPPALNRKRILIVDGIDYALFADHSPGRSPVEVSAWLNKLKEFFNLTIVTLSADAPLLHNVDASATGLEMDHSILARTLAHQSDWVMQVQSLATGHARDVTGVVRVSRGGGSDITEDDDKLPDGEWLYQVKNEGGVRIWGRGE